MPDNGDYCYPEARLLVFARQPVPGRVKTRLGARIGTGEAAEVYRQLAATVLRLVIDARLAPVQVHVTPDPRHPFFTRLAQRDMLSLHAQVDGDLGVRMCTSMDAALGCGGPVVLIGTDCPALDAVYLDRAFQALRAGRQVVLGPAEDGGYVLIGLRGSQPELFTGIDWGSERVLSQTRECIARLGLHCTELPTLWDVDRVEDLQRWRSATAHP